MDKVIEKKILEAKEHVQTAEKSLKTSFFKRTPDYDTAASEYNKAAMCCKIAKQFDKAIEYFQKSSDCYLSLKSQFNAAKQLEQVAFVANELKKNDITYQSIVKAADLFLENGTRDTAGILLEKGASMLKQNDAEKSLLLYKKAIYVAEVEDKYHDINSFYEHSIPLAMRLKKYNEAIELMRNCIENLTKINSLDSITKHLTSIVIIHLSNDDWVSAVKEIKTVKEKYNYSSERIEGIVDAFDEKNEEAYQTLFKTFLNYTLDNEVLKLAQKITNVGDWNKQTKVAKQPNVNVEQTQYKQPAYERPIPKFEPKHELEKEKEKEIETPQQPKQEENINKNIASNTSDYDSDEIPEL